ncbi:MAG TPA: pilus assembly protein TadG-related protein [Actinomycetota bacterium]|nr:pilus assembly protein TadG-related protein [Actinomycetota bacterium]
MRVKNCARDERGATIVLVALAMTALCGMVVLVVDVGGLLTLRRQMVTAADSAALAAAQSCAVNDAAGAAGQADGLATANQADASVTSFDTTDCGTASEGDVSVTYAAPKELAFAPIIGAPSERPVSASATAIWGPTMGVAPMPIELSINPAGEIDCAYAPVDTECAYWHDNNARPEWENSSHWGWLNLEESDMSPGDSCSSAGSSTRRGWIEATLQTELTITDDYSLVCADSGHSSSAWSEVRSQIGKIKYFPVNDPALMVTTSSREKYAIIGFIPLRIEDALRGNDPEAIGTPGDSGHCSGTHTFPNGSVFDLDTLGCYSGSPMATSDLEISLGKGKKDTVYQNGTDYSYNSTTHEVSWFAAAAPNADVSFSYTMAGIPGRCGVHDSDPNGICLVLSWQGPRVAGSVPGGSADFGLRAVRLDG